MKKIMTLLTLLYSSLTMAVSAPDITIVNLKQYTGNYISLYYVSGSKGSLGVKGQELNINKVLDGPVTKKITHDSISFQPRNIRVDGFAAFNFVVAVIHQQAEHFMTNAKLINGIVKRVAVDSRSREVADSEMNRRFIRKKHKSFFNIKRTQEIKF